MNNVVKILKIVSWFLSILLIWIRNKNLILAGGVGAAKPDIICRTANAKSRIIPIGTAILDDLCISFMHKDKNA